MLEYWPNAVNKNGEKLFTYDSTRDYGMAVKQFSVWEEMFGELKEASIAAVDQEGIAHRICFTKEWVQVQKPNDFTIV